MKINSVDWFVADRYRSIKSRHIVTLAGQKERYVDLTSCLQNDFYRNEAASGQGIKILPLKKLMHKIVEVVQ